jgi:CRISPR-associated endonuclease Csy4
MDAYLDIILLPDPEFPPAVLMNALFAKLHRGLVGQGGNALETPSPNGGGLGWGLPIGVSFPEVKDTALGGRLRLHGQAAGLERFMSTAWLAGMRDHIELDPIGPVPTHAKHRVVRRVQAKSNPERLRRRMMARKGVDAERARQAIPDSMAERLKLPYLVLKSQSTGQQFRLFIEHLPPQGRPVDGSYNAYGLSSTATVPWF